jgi:MazG family protein
MEDSKLNPKHFLLDELIQIVDTLRGKNGCPWDQKQTPQTVIVYLIEEAYELAEAIERENPDQIREELGDILFHILFITRIYREQGEFDLRDVVETISAKMIRRHPHVFDQKRMISSEEVIRNWHKIKVDEKKASRRGSLLDSVPVNLPALLRAYRISDRAAQSGIDWTDISGFMSEVEDNLHTLNTALKRENQTLLAQAFGELFLSLVNAARVAKIHPETALAGAVSRFENRFRKLEVHVSETGREFQDVSSEEKARLWAEIDKAFDDEAG